MHVFVLFAWPFNLAIELAKLCLKLSLLWQRALPPSSVPGPRMAAWTRLWWIKTLYSGRSAQELVRLNREYGMMSPCIHCQC